MKALAMQLLPSLSDAARVLRKAHSFLMFNAENPTGHYRLDLANPADYAIAERLKLLDRWEAFVGRRTDRLDTSELGNHSRARNVFFRRVPLHDAPSLAEWAIPEFDALELDYSSARRAPSGSKALDECTFRRILHTLHGRGVMTEGHLQALRLASDKFFLTSLHLRELVCAFGEQASRLECIAIFFTRLVDPHNSKVFRICMYEESNELHSALGFIDFFSFMQPEQGTWRLDLERSDQRIMAGLLLQLADGENQRNLLNCRLTRKDGIAEADPNPKDLPNEGIFEAAYPFAPSKVDFHLRQKFGQMYRGLATALEEDAVQWWTGCMPDIPDNIVHLAAFLALDAQDPQAAFQSMACSGAQAVDLEVFEAWLDKSSCQKFQEDRKTRIKALFADLDTDKAGQVTPQKWRLVEQLWREVRLCLQQFKRHLELAFGGDLAQVWGLLSGDTAEVKLEDWDVAAKRLHYFGPAAPVFKALDREAAGRITQTDFRSLDMIRHQD